jgi:hypothetical protein
MKFGRDLKLLSFLAAGLGLYLVSAGLSWAFFSRPTETTPIISPVSQPTPGKSGISLNLPKTEECPLTGEKFSLPERQIWEKRRPLTVMIENHAEARPQSGLSRADVVYEAVAEGGITRFLAVFYCKASAEEVQVGPVRSARTYFMDFASEYGDFPLYAHVGGANTPGPANALGQIADYGWVAKGNDLNQFSIGFPVFWRDYERLDHPVATEHTMYSTTEKLWQIAKERGLTNIDSEGTKWNKNFVAWKFKEDEPSGQEISPTLSFWSGYKGYDVLWQYDKEKNSYKRVNGDQPHQDLNNGEQLKAKTVVLAFMRESRANDGYLGNLHLLYKDKGSGEALIFQDGTVVKGTWSKEDRQSRMIFEDKGGNEIEFDAGPIWIEILPTGAAVNY